MDKNQNPNIFKQLKKIKKEAYQLLDNGNSKAETFKSLSSNLDEKLKKHLKDSIAFFVFQYKREKFKLLNTILIILAFTSGILIIPLSFEFFSHVKIHVISIISMVIFTFIHIQIVIGLFKWNGKIYKSIVFIEFMKLLGIFTEFNKGYYSSWVFAYIIVLIAEIILAIFLYKKIFPEYSWKGVKLDKENNYLFDKNIN